MIFLESPHVALNDSRSNMTLSMNSSIAVQPGDTPTQFLNKVVVEANKQPISNLVFNCHGSPGSLQMGTGVTVADVDTFRRLRGKVAKIWFYACSPASGGAGNDFCARIASTVHCYLLASTETQVETIAQVTQGLPTGTLDTYEGLLLCFSPDGTVGWSRRYPSTYQTTNPSGWYANP